MSTILLQHIHCSNDMMIQNRGAWTAGSRTRSRAISIEFNRSLDTDNSTLLEGSSRDRMRDYDSATWRMYTRIRDHRRKYPTSIPSHKSLCSRIPSHEGVLTEDHTPSWTEVSTALKTQVPLSEPFFEGEVFELEM